MENKKSKSAEKNKIKVRSIRITFSITIIIAMGFSNQSLITKNNQNPDKKNPGGETRKHPVDYLIISRCPFLIRWTSLSSVYPRSAAKSA